MNSAVKVLSIATVVTLAGCTSENLGDGSTTELDISGRWTVVEEVYDGKSRGVSSDTFFLRFYSDGSVFSGTHVGTYTIDQDVNPKQVDIVSMRHEPWIEPERRRLQPERNEPYRLRGIIEIKGGKLRVCVVNDPDLPRPTVFSTKRGDGRTLLMLERRDWPEEDLDPHFQRSTER